MSTHVITRPIAQLDELRYCYLCDQAGPHLSMQIEDTLVFQCHACFATHTDPLDEPAAEPRHRA